MRKSFAIFTVAALAACGGGATTTATTTGGPGGSSGTSTTGTTGSTGTAGNTGGAGGLGGTGGGGQGGAGAGGGSTTSTSSSTSSGQPCGGGCPAGSTCGTANGIEVCRAASGIPLFSNVYVIMMENTSLVTLQAAMAMGTAPNLLAMQQNYASGSDYHGVTHPSLPNYIALTSGDNQGISCDCHAAMGNGTCGTFSCNLVLGSCSCDKDVPHLGDQLEAAGKSWMAFGEDMGTPCNLTDSGNYAVRHVPFLYYDNVQTDQARCTAHVVDFSNFDPSSPSVFNFIAPNLVDDMHNPNLPSDNTAETTNIPNGDVWLGPQVAAITASEAYKKGGLLVVLWDEDDDSGGLFGSDDPVGIFVMSPYAKAGGYMSPTTANHYALLATIEDGLGLPRLAKAASATPLTDYFPDN